MTQKLLPSNSNLPILEGGGGGLNPTWMATSM